MSKKRHITSEEFYALHDEEPHERYKTIDWHEYKGNDDFGDCYLVLQDKKDNSLWGAKYWKSKGKHGDYEFKGEHEPLVPLIKTEKTITDYIVKP